MIAINLGAEVGVPIRTDRQIKQEGAYIADKKPEELHKLADFVVNGRVIGFLVQYENKDNKQIIQFHQEEEPPMALTGEQVNVVLNYLYNNLEFKE